MSRDLLDPGQALAPERGTVEANGLRLAYALWPGQGDPIVAVHGLTAHHMQYVGIAARLAGRRPMFAVDLRGRGDSDKPDGGYGMAQHADDVAAVMRAMGIGASVVFGHSMGAYIGAALAARHPGLVDGLFMLDGGYLLDPPPGVDPDELLDTLLKPQVERLRTTFPDRETYLTFWRSLPTFTAEQWGPWVEAYLDYDVAPAPDGGLRAKAAEPGVRVDFASMAAKGEVTERLRAVQVPVVAVRSEWGVAAGQPPVMPDAVMAELRACVPDLEEHYVPGTTHYTIALADPGATIVADRLVGFAERCGH